MVSPSQKKHPRKQENQEEFLSHPDTETPWGDDLPDGLQAPDGHLPEEVEPLFFEGDDRPASCDYCEDNGCDRCGQDEDQAPMARPQQLRKPRHEPPFATMTEEDRVELRRQYALAEAAPKPRGSETKVSRG